MGANDDAVDHQILIGSIGGEHIENPLPFSGIASAAEAPVHGLPAAIALRQVAPVHARAQNPQTSAHKHAPATAIAFGLLAFIAPGDRWAPWSFLLIALALFGIVLWLDRYVDGPIRRRLSARHAAPAPQVA